MPRPQGSADVLEARRYQALRLLKEGRSLHEVGRLVGCAASSVLRWQEKKRRGGPKALKVRTSPGRPPKLSPRHRRSLIRQLLNGAIAHGYETDLWTTARIAKVIRARFGVTYHRDHVGRLLQSLGWSHQKPERRAVERNEDAIERWKRKDWPRVKKTLLGWGPTSFSSTNRAFS